MNEQIKDWIAQLLAHWLIVQAVLSSNLGFGRVTLVMDKIGIFRIFFEVLPFFYFTAPKLFTFLSSPVILHLISHIIIGKLAGWLQVPGWLQINVSLSLWWISPNCKRNLGLEGHPYSCRDALVLSINGISDNVDIWVLIFWHFIKKYENHLKYVLIFEKYIWQIREGLPIWISLVLAQRYKAYP